jgi:hypothetical protein
MAKTREQVEREIGEEASKRASLSLLREFVANPESSLVKKQIAEIAWEVRVEKLAAEATAIAKILEPINARLLEIDTQNTVVAPTVSKLFLECSQINIEAKQAEQEVKAHLDNIYYIRERAKKIGGLNREQHARIVAENKAGKLTLPQVPSFEEAFGEAKARIAVHQATIKNLVGEPQATEFSGAVDTLLEQSRAAITKLAADRRMLARNKNAMLDVEKENLSLSGRITDVEIKRSEEILKSRATKIAENLSPEEAKIIYARLLARAPSITLDAKQQAVVAELKLSSLTLSPSVNMDKLLATEIDKAVIAHHAPTTSTALTAMALSIVPSRPLPSRPVTPPSPDSSGSSSDEELKVSSHGTPPGSVRGKTDTLSPGSSPDRTPPGSPPKPTVIGPPLPPIDRSPRPTALAEHARLHTSGELQQRAASALAAHQQQAIGTGLSTGVGRTLTK